MRSMEGPRSGASGRSPALTRYLQEIATGIPVRCAFLHFHELDVTPRQPVHCIHGKELDAPRFPGQCLSAPAARAVDRLRYPVAVVAH
jgi:hypothetical protein